MLQKISVRCLCSGDSGAAIGLSPAFYRRLVRHWSAAATGPQEGGIGHRSASRGSSFHITVVGSDVRVFSSDVIGVGCDVTVVCSDVTVDNIDRNLGVDGDPTPISL